MNALTMEEARQAADVCEEFAYDGATPKGKSLFLGIAAKLRAQADEPGESDRGSPAFPRHDTLTTNALGDWVPAIPLPFYGTRKKCNCGAKFWTLEGYRAHYALRHIIDSTFFTPAVDVKTTDENMGDAEDCTCGPGEGCSACG